MTYKFQGHLQILFRPSWSSSYGSWNYNYLCNQSLPPLKLCVRANVYAMHHYVIKFVSDLRQVADFLGVLLFPPPIKLTATMELTYC